MMWLYCPSLDDFIYYSVVKEVAPQNHVTVTCVVFSACISCVGLSFVCDAVCEH